MFNPFLMLADTDRQTHNYNLSTTNREIILNIQSNGKIQHSYDSVVKGRLSKTHWLSNSRVKLLVDENYPKLRLM